MFIVSESSTINSSITVYVELYYESVFVVVGVCVLCDIGVCDWIIALCLVYVFLYEINVSVNNIILEHIR